MSKMITILHRHACDETRVRRRMLDVLKQITPDLVQDARYDIRCEGSHFLGVIDLPDHMPRDGMCLCQGKLYDHHDSWSRPGSGPPDGSYALVRADAGTLEVLSDAAGSRTIWYYFDEEVFVASNSQRAITMYTGQFEENREAALWVLSSGGPGPDQSYNRALRLLPPDSRIRVDRAAWTMNVDVSQVQFEAIAGPKEEHLARIEEAVHDILGTFDDIDAQRSIVPLSGGADSRLIAATLRRLGPERRWRSYTGGPAEALSDPRSDAAIGTAVAEALGLDHRFIDPGPAAEQSIAALDRFVLAGEGRVDHLAGYLDGMKLLAEFRNRGEVVTIRGDVGMGGKPLPSAFAIRRTYGPLTCADIANLAPRARTFGWEMPSLPPRFLRRQEETLEAWRDRLHHSFYLPYKLGALTEMKAGFGDVFNPLASRRLLSIARSLPDDMRTGKGLYRELVRKTGPDLPFAVASGGSRQMFGFLQRPEVRSLLSASLRSETARRLYGDRFGPWLARDIDRRLSLAFRVRHALTRRVAARSPETQLFADPLLLAFRAYLAIAMTDRLQEDARLAGATRKAA